jgi:Tfp pilus assembly protein PilX
MTSVHMRHVRRRGNRQRGAVLIVALLLLLAVTALSTTAISTGVMEMRMSHNIESSMNTFQTGLAAVDFVISDLSNLPTSGPLNVPSNVSLSGAPFAAVSGESISASATRTVDCALPPRLEAATSMMAYSAFNYEIITNVARDGSGRGRSGMTQGYLLLGPKC